MTSFSLSSPNRKINRSLAGVDSFSKSLCGIICNKAPGLANGISAGLIRTSLKEKACVCVRRVKSLWSAGGEAVASLEI